MTTFGLLGHGEAGSAIGKGLRLGGATRIVTFDPGVAGDAARRQRAEDAGVGICDRVAQLADCDVVFSLVTTTAAVTVAEHYAEHAPAGQTYVDGNSTAPSVKQQVAAVLEPRSVEVVDAALTGGGIQLDGHRIPIALSGRQAVHTAELLRRHGLVASAMGMQVGQAAAMKMIRGVVMKGLEALSVEALTAARAYGIDSAVLDSLSDSLDRWEIREFITMLVRTHTVHSGRRSGEVRMIRDTVARAGVDPLMTTATQRLFDRSAAAGLRRADGGLPEDLEAAVRILSEALVDDAAAPATKPPPTP